MAILAQDIRIESKWKPFQVADKADRMRAANTLEGIGDRLRAVAFAEIQARDGFRWGMAQFPHVDPELFQYWSSFAEMEEEHAQLLINRALELNVDLGERKVSASLIRMFHRSDNAELFLYQMATAEERGMEVGRSMIAPMRAFDPISAAIFEKIAEDEVDHVAKARKFLNQMDVVALQARARSLAQAAHAGA